MHVYRLERGHPVLRRQFKDPLTRRLIAPGDQIVVCAHCRRPFLLSSWLSLQEMPDHAHRETAAGLEVLLHRRRLSSAEPIRLFRPRDRRPSDSVSGSPPGTPSASSRFRVRGVSSASPPTSARPPQPPPASRPTRSSPTPGRPARAPSRADHRRRSKQRWAVAAAVVGALITLLAVLL